MKISPVGTELFHGDGRRDRREEVIRRFSQFCEKRLKSILISTKFDYMYETV